MSKTRVRLGAGPAEREGEGRADGEMGGGGGRKDDKPKKGLPKNRSTDCCRRRRRGRGLQNAFSKARPSFPPSGQCGGGGWERERQDPVWPASQTLAPQGHFQGK